MLKTARLVLAFFVVFVIFLPTMASASTIKMLYGPNQGWNGSGPVHVSSGYMFSEPSDLHIHAMVDTGVNFVFGDPDDYPQCSLHFRVTQLNGLVVATKTYSSATAFNKVWVVPNSSYRILKVEFWHTLKYSATTAAVWQIGQYGEPYSCKRYVTAYALSN